MANAELRQEIKSSGVKQWQIADYLGWTESQFSKKMRYEMSEQYEDLIRGIILTLKKTKRSPPDSV